MSTYRACANVFGYQPGDVFEADPADPRVKAGLLGGHIQRHAPLDGPGAPETPGEDPPGTTPRRRAERPRAAR